MTVVGLFQVRPKGFPHIVHARGIDDDVKAVVVLDEIHEVGGRIEVRDPFYVHEIQIEKLPEHRRSGLTAPDNRDANLAVIQVRTPTLKDMQIICRA